MSIYVDHLLEKIEKLESENKELNERIEVLRTELELMEEDNLVLRHRVIEFRRELDNE